jgi:SAM-dependent methyltransferase
MPIQSVQEFIGKHNASVAGFVALGAALDAVATGTPLDPALAARVRDLLGAFGASDAVEGLSKDEALSALGMIRFLTCLDANLLFADRRTMAWSFNDPNILQAGGDGSIGHAGMLTRMAIPALDGLAARLGANGGAFLDVGTGAAGLAIAMARFWPEIRVVGIDPWQPSLRLARENIAKAGLGGRIEVREQVAEALDDAAAFDLAWVPVPFMPERVLPAALERVHRALRPGGWIAIATPNNEGDSPQSAAWRLRTTHWAGHALTPPDVERMCGAAGFTEVRRLPAPPGAPAAVIAGRRKAS